MVKPAADISDLDVAAWARLVRVSQNLLMQVEADLKSAGFPSLSCYDALLELKRAGAGGLRPFQLQEQMLLAQYNVSRLTDRFVKSGYAERLRSTEDGRGQVLKITKTGRVLLRQMWPTYRAAIQDHFAGKLDAKDVKEVSRILEKLKS